MKKTFTAILAAVLLLSLAACSSTQSQPEVPFEVGNQTAEYAVDGASGWTEQTVNIKIVAGDDILYNGTVTLISDDQFVSEVTYAAITETGISQEGVLSGFITSIGDYVAGNDASGQYMFWGYTVNGKYVPLACNQMRVLDGDYILWEFQAYDEDAAPKEIPSGITAPFEVGEQKTSYTVDGASGWTEQTVNIKIVAGDDILYNGTVTLTSDDQFVSEVTYAAITEAGISQDGVLSGFITSIGDYVAGNDASGQYMFWGYTVNGKYVPFSCNQMPVLDGDYILWEFQAYTE